jgi:hypothetical protein
LRKNWQNIIHSEPCPSIDKLVLYHEGKLSKNDSLAIESHAASCEICNDLLEGMAGLQDIDSLTKVEDELKIRLDKTLFRKRSKQIFMPVYQRIAIAASILIIAGIVFFLIRNNDVKIKQVAQVNQKTSPQVLEKTENKQEIKEKLPQESKNVERKMKNVPAKEKEKNTDFAMSDIQYEEGSGIQNNPKYSQGITADKVMENAPQEIAAVKPESETEKVDVKKERNDLSREKGAGIILGRSMMSDKNIVYGEVTDEKGAPMQGVNIVAKGTTKSVVTDKEGRFVIIPDTIDHSLIVSTIGYRKQEVSAIKNSNLKIILEPEVTALNEVDVANYGTQKKYKVAGNASSVKSIDINENLTAIRIQIDSLENILKNNMNDKALIKSLIEKYLEIQYKEEALMKLISLYDQTIDKEQKKDINEIIRLTKEENYSKALKKLKKLK